MKVGRKTNSFLDSGLKARSARNKKVFKETFNSVTYSKAVESHELSIAQQNAANLTDALLAFARSRRIKESTRLVKDRERTYAHFFHEHNVAALKKTILEIFKVLSSDTRFEYKCPRIACGRLDSFLRSHVEAVNKQSPMRRMRTAQGLLTVLRCQTVNSAEKVLISVNQHDELLHSEIERNETTEEEFLIILDKVVDEVCPKKMLRWTDKTSVPMRGCYGGTRDDGCFRTVVRDFYGLDAQLTDKFRGFQGTTELREPNICLIDLLEDFGPQLEQRALLQPRVEVSVVHAKGKNRVVTKCDGSSTILSLPLQEYLFESIARHPTFRFTHQPIEYDLPAFRKVLTPGAIHVSGDFERATDSFCPSWSQRVVERVCRRLDLSPNYTAQMSKFVGPVILDNGLTRNFEKVTTCGQLMGNPLSFPILCMINAAIYLTAKRRSAPKERYQELKDCPVLINGDDIVFDVPEGVAALDWINVVSELGLKVSTAKSGFSTEYFSLNSRVMYFEEDIVKQVPSPLINLILGRRDNGCLVKIANDDVEIFHHAPNRKNPWEMSDELNYVVYNLSEESQRSVLKRALALRGIDYKTTIHCPYTSVQMGGLGVNPPRLIQDKRFPSRFRVDGYEMTSEQLRFASFCRSDMNRKPWDRIVKVAIPEWVRYLQRTFGRSLVSDCLSIYKPVFGSSVKKTSFEEVSSRALEVFNKFKTTCLDWSGPDFVDEKFIRMTKIFMNTSKLGGMLRAAVKYQNKVKPDIEMFSDKREEKIDESTKPFRELLVPGSKRRAKVLKTWSPYIDGETKLFTTFE